MKQPDPMRRPVPPARTDRQHRRPPPGRFVASAAVLALVLAGCGRSAPVDALGATEGDPDIAGVTITSPDTVIDAAPTSVDTSSTSTTATPPPQQVLHTVEPGDTLSVIAGNYGVSTDELAAYNGITDVNSITPGDQLAIPPATSEPAPAPTEDTTEGTTASG